jgi:hypothetical protein
MSFAIGLPAAASSTFGSRCPSERSLSQRSASSEGRISPAAMLKTYSCRPAVEARQVAEQTRPNERLAAGTVLA